MVGVRSLAWELHAVPKNPNAVMGHQHGYDAVTLSLLCLSRACPVLFVSLKQKSLGPDCLQSVVVSLWSL